LLYEDYWKDYWKDDELRSILGNSNSIELFLNKAEQGNYAALVPLYYAVKCNGFTDEKVIRKYENLLHEAIGYIQRENKYLFARARWQSVHNIT